MTKNGAGRTPHYYDPVAVVFVTVRIPVGTPHHGLGQFPDSR